MLFPRFFGLGDVGLVVSASLLNIRYRLTVVDIACPKHHTYMLYAATTLPYYYI